MNLLSQREKQLMVIGLLIVALAGMMASGYWIGVGVNDVILDKLELKF